MKSEGLQEELKRVLLGGLTKFRDRVQVTISDIQYV